MTPLQQFRVWLRRSTVGARAAAATAAILSVSLLAWLITPVNDTDQLATLDGTGTSTTTAGGRDAQGEPTTSVASSDDPTATGVTSAPGAPGATGSAPAAGDSPTATGGCASGSAPGVTGSEIKIAVVLVSIFGPAGNSTFGVPSVSEQQQNYDLVIADTNAHGGVACRKLVPTYYQANPADQANQQQTCLDIIGSGAFAVIDLGAYILPPPSKECFATQGPMPFIGTAGLTDAQMSKYSPYLITLAETFETLHRDTAHALAERGFFEPANGFKKLGLLYRDCPPELPTKYVDNLHEVGVTDNQIVTYNLGCPSGFASPADLQQAVLKYKSAGVTHMTILNATADFANFTRTAQQQGFRPKWGFPDEGQAATAKGALAPDPDNLVGAISIIQGGYGQENTDLPLSPGTVRCNAIFNAADRPEVYKQPAGAGGVSCSQIWVFKTAVERAPALDRAALAQGLQAAGAIEVSWPSGDKIGFAPGHTAGGGYWRPLQFFRDCTCWKPLDPVFRPSFS